MSVAKGCVRTLATLAALTLAASACAPTQPPGATTELPSQSPVPTVATLGTEAPPVAGPSALGRPSGTAPLRLANSEPNDVYLTYGIPLSEARVPTPAGASLTTSSCRTAGPGVIVFDVDVQADSFPFDAPVMASLYRSDTAGGAWGLARFEVAGQQRVIVSLGTFRPVAGTFEVRGEGSVDRTRLEESQGMGCGLEFGSDNGSVLELDLGHQEIELTAPDQTVELAAQIAFNEGPDSALYPLAIIYGSGVGFYSDLWFLPSGPEQLDKVREQLDSSGCLELKFTYQTYSVVQSTGCPERDQPAEFQAGNTWIATADVAPWHVSVVGENEETVASVRDGLTSVWLLSSVDLPIIPNNERELGRGTLRGREILITSGEQKCSSNCSPPEGWFFLYTFDDQGVVPLAEYPAWGGCLLAEEEDFVIAIAPFEGSIEVSGIDVEPMVSNRGRQVLFLETGSDSFTVALLDSGGNTPACVGDLERDSRGGLTGSYPTPATPPEPSDGERFIQMETCTRQPLHYSDISEQPPINQACVQTEFGNFWVLHVVPSPFMVDPGFDGECLVGLIVSGGTSTCFEAGSTPSSYHTSGDEGIRWAAVMVPLDTLNVTALTDRDTIITMIPLNGVGVVWWLESEGSLLEMIAETEEGVIELPVDL